MDVVIFGLGPFASLIWYELVHDSRFRVVGFTADRAYCSADQLHHLPVVPFEALEQRFGPTQVRLLFAVGPHRINGLRADRFHSARQRGYGFANYVSSRATVWPDLALGANCMLLEEASVQPFARIGDNCFLAGRSHVSHHAQLADHCFLSPNAIVAGCATVGTRCFLGTGCIVRDGVAVASRCFIAAGAVVTADTQEGGVYMGVPARRQEISADEMVL